MKLLITTIAITIAIVFFSQCKKNNNPVPGYTDNLIANGKYIIRSKYFCSGGCFVFRSLSNYETINWEWVTKETLESIKKDADPFNSYVWDIARTGAIGDAIYYYADPSSDDGIGEKLINPLNYYTIYQQKPDGFFSYLPSDPLPYGYTDDQAETGGPSAYVSMRSTDLSPVSSDFDHDQARLFIRQITDSTHRITLMRNGMWATYFSLLFNPDGSDCDELQDINTRPTWRGTWLCPHTSSIGSAWLSEACYTSNLVFEKIN